MMKQGYILALMKEKRGAIITAGLLLAALSFLFLIVSEKKFKVNSDFLVVQNAAGSQDIYTLAKSAEYMGKVLNEAVYSELFIDAVEKTGKVNPEFLPFEKKDRLKEWSKIVKVSRNGDLGIISVQSFYDDSKQAMAISNAVAEVLTTKNNLFRGEGQSIEVRVLSGPVIERNPAPLDIAIAMLGGFFFGMLLMAIRVYYVNEKYYTAPQPNFDLQAGEVVYPQSLDSYTKQRMENSGVFADEQNY